MHTVEVNRTRAEFSVTDLADRSAVPVSSIRMYQQRRLLPPPVRRGRNGVYDQSHLDRLLLIERLQAKGYSLAAILDVIENGSGEIGRLVDAAVPMMADHSVTMSLVELIQELPEADFSLDTLQRIGALGLLQFNGSEVTVREPAFLEAGKALSGLNIPTTAILDAYETLQTNVQQIALEFARVFDTYTETGRVLQAGALSADLLDDATAQLEQLTKTAIAVVSSELRHALRGIATERLTKLSLAGQSPADATVIGPNTETGTAG